MLLDFTKMELYRILKMKSTYILAAVMVVLCIFYGFFLMGFNIGGLFGISSDDYDSYTSMDDIDENVDNGVYEEEYNIFGGSDSEQVQNDVNNKSNTSSFRWVGEGLYHDNDVAEMFYMNEKSLNGLMLLGIFAGLFFGETYTSGINKNFNRYNKNRWVGPTAKVLAAMVYTFVFQVITWIMSFITCAIWARKLVLGFDKAFFIYFFVAYLISVAFLMTVAFVAILFRTKAGAITYAVIMALGTLDLIIKVGDLIIEYILEIETKFSLADLLLTMNLSRLTLNSSGRDVIVAIVCGLVYLASSYMAGLLLVKKRDIR